MLNKIKIKKYQSHDDTVIDLHSGVNVVTGTGCHGKTAIKRAVLWTLTNRPLGFKYNSHFSEDPTEVELEFDDANIKHHKAARRTKDTPPEYVVNGQEFDAVNRGVPDQVTEAAKLSDINFQGQFDKPFLLTMNSAELARMFNRVAQMDDADKWLADLKQQRKVATIEMQSAEDKVRTAQRDLDQLKGIDEAGELLKEAANAEALSNEKTEQAAQLKRIYGKLKNRQATLERWEVITRAYNLYTEAKFSYDFWATAVRAADDARRIKAKVARLALINSVIDTATKAASEADKQLTRMRYQASKANCLRRWAAKGVKHMAIESKQLEVKNSYIEAIKASGKCPTCMAGIDSEALRRILEEL